LSSQRGRSCSLATLGSSGRVGNGFWL
jgi:hypothetical protein